MIEIRVDGGTEHRKILEVFVLERLVLKVPPQPHNEIEVGRIRGQKNPPGGKAFHREISPQPAHSLALDLRPPAP